MNFVPVQVQEWKQKDGILHTFTFLFDDLFQPIPHIYQNIFIDIIR